jgi:hypothetical protein
MAYEMKEDFFFALFQITVLGQTPTPPLIFYFSHRDR